MFCILIFDNGTKNPFCFGATKNACLCKRRHILCGHADCFSAQSFSNDYFCFTFSFNSAYRLSGDIPDGLKGLLIWISNNADGRCAVLSYFIQSVLRPSSALISVTLSANSSSAPTGTPCAIRETVIPLKWESRLAM